MLKILVHSPAKVEMSLVLNDVPNQVSVLLEQVSYVELLCLITGEGEAKLETSLGCEVFKFLEEEKRFVE